MLPLTFFINGKRWMFSEYANLESCGIVGSAIKSYDGQAPITDTVDSLEIFGIVCEYYQ
jgi:hypothetical protein